MARRIVGGADLVLFVILIGFGLWVVHTRPWTLDAASAASLAGAVFGGAAVLLGNWINRSYEREKAASERSVKTGNMKALIAAELVNVAAGLLDSKRLFDAGIMSIRAGGPPGGQIEIGLYLPRDMPFTNGLGIDLLSLDGVAVDALTTLRSNLAQTKRSIEEAAPVLGATMGLSLLTAMRISNGLGHDMTVLAEAIGHIAPGRKWKMAEDQEPRLVSQILMEAAPPP
jgi:hypothetical protein